MENWIPAMPEITLPEGAVRKSRLDGHPLLLAKSNGTVYAMLDQCPHLGCALHRGELAGFFLKCPCHDWLFDIRSGEFVTATEIKIPIYPVKVDNGTIFVNMGGENR